MKKILYLLLGIIVSTFFLCNDEPINEILEVRLEQHTGTWEGTYTYLTPSGTITDRHTSRQEARLEGTTWQQAFVYHWPNGRERTHTFEAEIKGGKLVYDAPNQFGDLYAVTGDVAVFSGYQRQNTNHRTIETLVSHTRDHQTRTVHVYAYGDLEQIILIDERRVQGGN